MSIDYDELPEDLKELAHKANKMTYELLQVSTFNMDALDEKEREAFDKLSNLLAGALLGQTKFSQLIDSDTLETLVSLNHVCLTVGYSLGLKKDLLALLKKYDLE